MSTSSDVKSQNVLQFSPLQSFVNPTFWHKLAELKIDFDRLSDAPKSIYGYYTNRNTKACLLEVEYSAFNSEFKAPKFCYPAIGTLYNKNTIEDFKECDKSQLLQEEGRKLLADFKNGKVLDDPSYLSRFFILSFADLKCHNYYYWFAFPCPLTPTLNNIDEPRLFKDIPEIQHFASIIKSMPIEIQNYFVIKSNKNTSVHTLKEVIKEIASKDIQLVDYYFCFANNNEFQHPSWHMRTYAAFIFHQCHQLIGKEVKFLGLRYDNQMEMKNSLLWTVVQNEPIDFSNPETVQFVGWEPNRNNKMGPRMVSMKDSMDPTKLAENSVYLNLKLMKWRLVPELNLDILTDTKCLLFGAGTLGCAVARNLLAWGFKYITFLDSGKVSFSNPVRQCLYLHTDAVAGNVMKAKIAAERLVQINPSTVATGYVMQIPMPGHTIGEAQKSEAEADINKIRELVTQHDVIFLLTDSRESRWLPTLLGAAHNKIVINTALGFDSYLVMRHGGTKFQDIVGDFAAQTNIGNLKCINGNSLGCYFCNDVTAPGNSLKDRTLDQQCTVTRPGVSNIAASYAVELLVSILQHPQKDAAPAYYSSTNDADSSDKTPEGLLGIIPHSIRGMLCNYENILPATHKFSQCIACSEKVITEYRQQGNQFLFKAFETAKYLEDLTGISEFKDLNSEIIDYDDSDLEMSDE